MPRATPDGMKLCTGCGIKQAATYENFPSSKKLSDGFDCQCRACQRADSRARWARDPERSRRNSRASQRRTDPLWPGLTQNRKHTLGYKYGLDPASYLTIQQSQDYRCAVCHRPFLTLWCEPVDHCHETGNVCGILCLTCNQGLGLLGEDAARLARAATYVRKNKRPKKVA